MKNGLYESRKEQIAKDFIPSLMRQLKLAGCAINAKGRKLIAEELKTAAMVGAAEERSRILAMAEPRGYSQITERSVMSVLGYTEK